MVSLEIQGTPYVPIHDISGNVVCLTDHHGEVIERYRYTVFGEAEILSPSGKQLTTSPIGNPYQYASKRLDPETSFIAFGLRYYDPSLGRWLTPDPAGYDDGPNLYAYVHNSPLLYYDQFGLMSIALNTSINPNMQERLWDDDRSIWEKLYSHFTNKDPSVYQINYEKFLISDASPEEHLNSLSIADDILPSSCFSEEASIFNLNNSGLIDPQTNAPYNFREISGLLIGGVNGNDNNNNSFRRSMIHLASLANHNFIAVHSPTFGLAGDIFRCISGKFRVASETVKKIHDVWYDFFRKNPHGRVCWTAHSRGCIDTRNALLSFPKELRERITIIAVAPACFIEPELCQESYYLVSKGDLIPYTDFSRMIKYQHLIDFVPADTSMLSSHALTSQVYEPHLERLYQNFEKWNK